MNLTPLSDMRLHLACGRAKLPGFVGVDLVPLPGVVDVVQDLTKFPWPFPDNCAAEIVMRNILEHLPDTLPVMEEVWRIAKPGARVNVLVPYYNSPGAWGDPTHRRAFNEETFDYMAPSGEKPLSAYNYYTHARFRVTSLDARQNRWLKQLPARVRWTLAHHFATVHTLDFQLEAVK